jgi:hypothetical protein
MMYSIPLQFFIQKLLTVLLALCHFVDLEGFSLILLKICCKILRHTTPIKKNSGIKTENNFVGLNIFGA